MVVRTACIICLAAFAAFSAAARASESKGQDTTPIRNFVLTSEKIRSFRTYTAVERPVLRPGDALHIYGEPEHFGWHSSGGKAKFNVIVSARLRRSDGRSVVRNVSPISLDHEAASQPSDFFFSLRLKINAPAGSYAIDVRLHDRVAGQTIEKSFPFSIGTRRELLQPEAVAANNQARQASPKLAAPEKAPRAHCKEYFPQVGAMIAVPCEQ